VLHCLDRRDPKVLVVDEHLSKEIKPL